MNNRLYRIDANPLDRKAKHSINTKTVVDAVTSLRREVSTKEEYVLWVKEWKETHAEIVNAIQFFRAMKNRIKYDATFANSTSDNCNTLQWNKKWFGKLANGLYDLRAENKTKAKARYLAQLETEVA